MMILIHRDGFYSRADLAELLEPHGVDVDTFLARIKPRRILRALYRGSDLLTGWDHAKELSEPVSLPPARNRGNRKQSARKTGNLIALEEIGLASHDKKTA